MNPDLSRTRVLLFFFFFNCSCPFGSVFFLQRVKETAAIIVFHSFVSVHCGGKNEFMNRKGLYFKIKYP